MATKQSDPSTPTPSPATNAPSNEDGSEWTSDEVPRLSFGSGVSKKGEKLVTAFQGRFLYSIQQRIKKRATTLHRFENAIVDGERVKGEVLVYGSGAINDKIAKIPTGTPLRMKYLGDVDVGQDSPMKNIKLEWPKGTALLNKPVAPQREPGEDDEGPF